MKITNEHCWDNHPHDWDEKEVDPDGTFAMFKTVQCWCRRCGSRGLRYQDHESWNVFEAPSRR